MIENQTIYYITREISQKIKNEKFCNIKMKKKVHHKRIKFVMKL